MSILRRALTPERRNADPEVVAELQSRRLSSRSTAGEVVNFATSLSHDAVWACVRLLADTTSSLPLCVYRDDADGFPHKVTPGPLIVERPSATVTQAGFVYQVMASLLLRGNFYARVLDRDRDEYPTQMESLHPDNVAARDDGAWLVRVEGRTEVVAPEDVWHVPAWLLPGSRFGLSPIAHHAATIGVGLAAKRFGGDWFGKGAHPSALLRSEAELTKKQAEDVKRRWRSSVQSGEAAVLGAGWEYQPLQVAAEESQFIETQRLTVEQVARVFGVPAEMIGGASQGSSITYANLVDRNRAFLTYTLHGWLRRIEDGFSDLLPRGLYVRFDTDRLLRANTADRYTAWKTALEAGWLTVDEVRRMEDLPASEEAGRRQDALKPNEAVTAATALIRAGFEPHASLQALGLPPVTHTGLLPVTVQAEAAERSEPVWRIETGDDNVVSMRKAAG